MSDIELEHKEEPGALSKALKFIAYPVAAFTGFLSARTTIRSHAYDNVLRHEATKDIHDDVFVKMKEKGHWASDHIKAGKGSVDFIEETKAMHKTYEHAYETRMGELKLGSLWRRWKFNQPHQQQQVIINGLTVAGITLGAVLTMAHSKTLGRVFTRHEAQKDPSDSPSL
jgi:hypothetical protein